MDRAPPVFKVLYLLLDKKRASSNAMRQHEGPISIADKPLQLHEKEEGSVYPSVGKKRPPCSLGKGN